ncbi:MAG: hypothetical protein C0490_19570 [Marivirga sp.]|nr:hypothetical protein [Marivirga sp.]
MPGLYKKQFSTVLFVGCLCLVAGSCKDDDNLFSQFVDTRDGKDYKVMKAGGTLWFAEDLKFEDSISYSYQQALNACPAGWSLPTKEDWISLNNYFGGYIYNGDEIGDPKKAYNRVLQEFGMEDDTFYWTSTPAWDDAASIRSSVFGINSYFMAVEYGAIIVNARLRCRCVNKTVPENAKDFIRVKTDNQLQTFDFYRIDWDKNKDKIDLFLHRKLNKMELLDRIKFHFTLPSKLIGSGDTPVAALNAQFERQLSSLPEWTWKSHLAIGPENFEVIITFYDGSVVKGTFSGIGFDSIPIDEGTFELEIIK